MSNTIPMTVTRLNGQEYPVNLYHDRFHQKRVVSLNGVIDEKMAESIIAQLEYLDEMETADISRFHLIQIFQLGYDAFCHFLINHAIQADHSFLMKPIMV